MKNSAPSSLSGRFVKLFAETKIGGKTRFAEFTKTIIPFAARWI